MGWESFDVVRFDLGPLLQGQTRTAKLKRVNNLIYPQTKVGDILDSGPSRRRRRRRNFLVYTITQKRINIVFSNLVHILRVPKGRSLF